MDSIACYSLDYEFYKKYPIQSINTLEENKQILEQIKIELRDLGKLEENMKPNELLNLCCKALENGYLISQQLRDMLFQLDKYKSSKIDIYKQFKFKNYQQDLLNFIKPDIGWRNKERDFNIYVKIKKGTLYQEIAEKEEISVQAISQINSKIQNSISNLKGRFYEIEYEKYLKSLNKFKNCKVVRDGSPGKPDIIIIDEKNNTMYIFSLKNLELNKNPYCVIVEELKPELQFTYYNYTFEIFTHILADMIISVIVGI